MTSPLLIIEPLCGVLVVAGLAGPAGAAQPITDAVEEASVDRGLLSPTALTQPSGSVTLSDYEVVGVSASVGILGRAQLSVGAMSWGLPFGVAGSLKVRMLSIQRVHVAVIGAAAYWRQQKYVANAFLLFGAASSLCLDEACRSVASAFAITGRQYNDMDDAGPSSSRPLLLGAGLVLRVAESLALVLESSAFRGFDCTRSYSSCAALTYLSGGGVRLMRGRLWADVALLVRLGAERLLGDCYGCFGPYPVLPFASVSYRWP